MASDALVLSEIDAFYGDSHVLHGVSLRLPEGSLLGLLGRNGAGKSTSLNVTVGLLAPRRGAVVVYGLPVTGRSPEAIAAQGVALDFAERITVLHFGEVVVEGTRSEVVDHPRTREIYLGE